MSTNLIKSIKTIFEELGDKATIAKWLHDLSDLRGPREVLRDAHPDVYMRELAKRRLTGKNISNMPKPLPRKST